MRLLLVLLVAACGSKQPLYSPPPPVSQGTQAPQTPKTQGVGTGSAASNAPSPTDERPTNDRPTDEPTP
jgi:predicted small lipoprotein YifL